MTKQTEKLLPCPFMIGDKVKIITPYLKKDWENSECYIVGINLTGDNLDIYNFTIVEVGVRGTIDGFRVHDLKCIERTPNLSAERHGSPLPYITLSLAEFDQLTAMKRESINQQPNLSALDSDEAVDEVSNAMRSVKLKSKINGYLDYRYSSKLLAKSAIQAVKGILK